MDLIEELKKILDSDSCECDNCNRTRAFFKNPHKEIARYKQINNAKTNNK